MRTLLSRASWALLLALAANAAAQQPESVAIPYLPPPVVVNGEPGKWSAVPAHRMEVERTAVVMRFAWNEEALYALVEVGDATRVVTAFSDEDPHLTEKSDAVELFLDTHLERAPRMDTNDYQIAVARDGRRTTFKGSAALHALADVAIPRDWGMNLPLQVVTIDGPEAGPAGKPGYRVEIAVPWTAIGLRATPQLRFGFDVAVDDLVTPPQGDIPPKAVSGSWSKDPLLGLPDHWKVAELKPAPAASRFARTGARFLLPAVAGALLLALGWFLAARRRREVVGPVAGAEPSTAPLPQVVTGATSPAEDPLEKLRVVVGQRLGDDLTAEDLAEAAGVSLRTLQRLFRERHDTTPVNWLIEVRLQEAARLILESDDPVTKIAYRVGFKDPSHFTRRFKARFGVSPAEYRKVPSGDEGGRS